MTFSWLGLAIAPLPVLLLAAIGLSTQSTSFSIGAVLFTAILGAPLGYAGAAAAAGCLLILSKFGPVGRLTSAACGLILAAIEYLGFIWLSWSSSGPDSGPPTDTFASHLLRDWKDPMAFIFLGCGLVTALLYDYLTWRRPIRKAKPSPA